MVVKLDMLNILLWEKFSIKLELFRSGCWGINVKILCLLVFRGYKVDLSVYFFYKNDYFSCIGVLEKFYWFFFENVFVLG